jgi:ubiquinone/menaquinone biosynthesis C-methylase UbiE
LTSRPWVQKNQFSVSTLVLPSSKSPASTERNVQNNEFKIRDAYNVDAEDGTFDVVHYHQLLIQLSDPVKASKEMKRVCKFGACCF